MGLFSTLFGSAPKAGTSESGNSAYPWVMQNYGGMASGGVGAFNALGSLLGLGGSGGSTGGTSSSPGTYFDYRNDGIPGNAAAARAAGQPDHGYLPGTGVTTGTATGSGTAADQQGAYDNFLNNSGFNWIMDNAMQGVTNSAAGKYLLRSGSTAKALQDRAANISKTYFQDYLDRLAQQSQLGLGAGSLISGAGQYSKGTGGTQGSQGLLGSALQILPSLFSDPRLKTDIKPVGKVTVYDWRYKWDDPGTKRRGFMADEVEKVHPEAMGPKVAGYRTIDPLALVGAR
jgi:hypothetical protein